MRSLLYRKIIDDKRLDQWRGMECIDIISQIDFLKPEQAKQCMADLKNYLYGTNLSFISHLDQYEIFAKDSAGNPWLENQNTGVVKLFIIKNIYHSDFWRSGFTSVEAAVFADLLKYAEKYIAELGLEYDEMRFEFRDAVERIADLLPIEWSNELYAISEKQFEKSCSLITPEQLIQLIDKYSLISYDL